ncbi:MAG: hypothetical protein ISS28_01315 [Candidatus Cloacimonetes bacterium]|nr:hypothetical protein [Candidatus Cloacimonadota bacterium]
MKKLFLILLLGGILLFPLISQAGQYAADGHTVEYTGLVPCGKCVKIPGIAQSEQDIEKCGHGESSNIYVSCQFCHFFVMLKGIIDFFLLPPTGIIFLIAVLMLVVAGVMFLIAHIINPGNPELVSQAQKVLTSVIAGLAIIFCAWIFVNTFFLFIGVSNWTGLKGGWFTIECNIHLP